MFFSSCDSTVYEDELSTTTDRLEAKNNAWGNNQQAGKTAVLSQEMLIFKAALTEICQPKYQPTKEYTEKHGNQLSDERKQILLQPAKELIFSTGISEKELVAETDNQINLILQKAFKIYALQTEKPKVK